MKQKDIRIGGRYWTKVSGEKVEVEVIQERMDSWSNRTKYLVRRVATGQILPKTRTAAALHPVRDTYWPSMTEKQEDLGALSHDFEEGDIVTYRDVNLRNYRGEVTSIDERYVWVLWRGGHSRPVKEWADNLKPVFG